jgi:hypothetical protein
MKMILKATELSKTGLSLVAKRKTGEGFYNIKRIYNNLLSFFIPFTLEALEIK